MVFTDIIFLPFLIVTYSLFLFFRHSQRLQFAVLLAASIVFYGWWNIQFVPLLLISGLLDYYAGKKIYATTDLKRRRLFLVVSLVGNLGLLAYFKYMGFFVESVRSGLEVVGVRLAVPHLNIILPIAISFYTFETISYTIDIYQGKLKPIQSFLKYLVFLTVFPRLVAGPIVRAGDILPQLDENLAKSRKTDGLFLIVYGLIKKIFIADLLAANIVDPIFAKPLIHTSLEIWIATYAYAFQIFLDFSAYSDIAIGVGRLFGITFPNNFKFPYSARNPSEFWTKWHISLSTWLRDYLYIPLGGNRGSSLVTARNLMLVMLLGGLWHGANWTFVVWGCLHGFYLLFYRYVLEKLSIWKQVPDLVKSILFFHLVCFAWIFFRAANLGVALSVVSGLFHLNMDAGSLTFGMLWLLLGASFVHYVLEPRLDKLTRYFDGIHWSLQGVFLFLMFISIRELRTLGIANDVFIYFQF